MGHLSRQEGCNRLSLFHGRGRLLWVFAMFAWSDVASLLRPLLELLPLWEDAVRAQGAQGSAHGQVPTLPRTFEFCRLYDSADLANPCLPSFSPLTPNPPDRLLFFVYSPDRPPDRLDHLTLVDRPPQIQPSGAWY